MKLFSTVLAAALVAGSCTVAMAQAGGGAAGGDQTQQGTMKDADKNPSGAGANPTAGNTAAPAAGQGGQGAMSGQSGQSGMTTAPAANTRSDSPQRPAGAKDATGGSTGGGATK
jgi:hypothetical protein